MEQKGTARQRELPAPVDDRMYIEDLIQAGNDILDDVIEAIDKNEYTDLGKKIRTRVKDVAEEAGWTAGGGTQKTPQGRPQQAPYGQRQNYAQQPYGQRQNYTQQPYGQAARGTAAGAWSGVFGKTNFLRRRVGRTGPTLKTVFGGIGMFAFGLPTIICLAELIMEGGGAMLAGTIIFGLLTAATGFLLRSGIRGGRLVSRYYAYGAQIGSAEYISIPELAAQSGRSEKEVRKDLLEMMHRGILPQARMDTQQKTLILTDEAYGLYRQAEQGRLQRAAEEAAKKKTAAAQQTAAKPAQQKNTAGAQQSEEVREILERGNTYIRKVRNVNDMIPDTEEMSTKLYRLEEITHRIFEQVQKQPESAAGLRRFMDYYLPTTEKLLDAYVELDRQPAKGANITRTKQEIDEAMDVINDAFENLLNNMFETMAWDISSDISVMKTMLAQDGLTEKKPLFEFGAAGHKEKEPVPVHSSAAEENTKQQADRAMPGKGSENGRAF